MKTLIILVLLSILCSSKIYQVVSMFRHGARYYLNNYYDANDILRGELSAVGMKQHQRLG